MTNYILKDENAVYYECGFSCDNELFLKLGSDSFFITDPRYTTEAKEYVKNAEVIEAKRDIYIEAKKLIRASKAEKSFMTPLTLVWLSLTNSNNHSKSLLKLLQTFHKKRGLSKVIVR